MTIKMIGDLCLNYFAMGSITFGLFFLDKRAAQLQQKRIAETWLMTASVLFGWIGAILAMKYLRHKNRKKTFNAKMVIAVLANLVIIYMMIK